MTEVREQERGAETVLCSGVVFGVRGAGPTDGKSWGMREEVAKATLCQPRLTLALLVHSDQYSITVSSRTKHTPSTLAPLTLPAPLLPSPSLRSSRVMLLPRSSPSRQRFFFSSLASFLDYPPALFLFVSSSARSSFNLSPVPSSFPFSFIRWMYVLSCSLSRGLMWLALLSFYLRLSFTVAYFVVSLVHQPSCLCPAVGSLGAVIAKIIAPFSVGHPRKQSRELGVTTRRG